MNFDWTTRESLGGNVEVEKRILLVVESSKMS